MKKIITKSDVTFLPIDKIKKNPLNTFGEDKFEDLKNSIATYGLITPVSVIGPDHDGFYTLIAGEQRLRAYESLKEEGNEGYEQIAVYVVGDLSMSQTEQKILIESSNIDTRDSFDRNAHCFQIIKLLKQLDDEQGLTKKEYIKMRKEHLKCSARYARFYEQIFNSENDELQEMVESGELSVSRAGRIASMPEDIQQSAIQDIKEGKDQDDVVNRHSQMEKGRNSDQNNSSASDKSDRNNKKSMNDFEIPESELDMFDPLGNDNFKSDDFDSEFGSEFDQTEDDFNEFDEEFDFQNFNTSILNCGSSVGAASDGKNDTNIKAVLAWCAHMKKVDTPTDAEWEAIEACKKVVEKFI